MKIKPSIGCQKLSPRRVTVPNPPGGHGFHASASAAGCNAHGWALPFFSVHNPMPPSSPAHHRVLCLAQRVVLTQGLSFGEMSLLFVPLSVMGDRGLETSEVLYGGKKRDKETLVA